jgi:hypothetical protein
MKRYVWILAAIVLSGCLFNPGDSVEEDAGRTTATCPDCAEIPPECDGDRVMGPELDACGCSLAGDYVEREDCAQSDLRCFEGACVQPSEIPCGTTVEIPPRATFLQTLGDDRAADPVVIALAEHHLLAGDPVLLRTVGSYQSGVRNFKDVANAVFSASSDFKSDTQADDRVVDALPTEDGQPASVGESEGLLGIDEDFVVRTGEDAYTVTVPPNATHLFLGVFDAVYADNRSTDAEFQVVLECPDLGSAE